MLDEFDNAHLSPGAEYLVVGLDDTYFRVLDDAGEPILYPKYLFDVTKHEIPKDWVRRDEDDGRYYTDPPECARPGFYEDYFDGVPDAVATFQSVLARLWGTQ